METNNTAALQKSTVNGIAVMLESMGWQILNAEVDLTAETAKVELKRFDGLLVTLAARPGSASITRERQASRRIDGRHSLRETTSHELIGREKFVGEGVRSSMRWLANYIDDNSGNGLRLARPALRLLLSGAE